MRDKGLEGSLQSTNRVTHEGDDSDVLSVVGSNSSVIRASDEKIYPLQETILSRLVEATLIRPVDILDYVVTAADAAEAYGYQEGSDLRAIARRLRKRVLHMDDR